MHQKSNKYPNNLYNTFNLAESSDYQATQKHGLVLQSKRANKTSLKPKIAS